VGPPDLTGVDLRTLRAMDDPAVLAAVAGVLADPEGLRRVWYTTGDDDLIPGRPGHAFSAGPACPLGRGEDTVA
jgi:FXSXX-COOH protein